MKFDPNNIPTESLYELFKSDVLGALHFVLQNRLKLEHRPNLNDPWRDEWDRGYDFKKMMSYVVLKPHREEIRLDSWMLHFWRIKQPDIHQAVQDQVKW